MIPKSWLKERLETTDLQELTRRELTIWGLSDSDLQKLLAEGLSPQWIEKWREFVSQMTAGDELWLFKSHPDSWKLLAGAKGYAIVRSGRIISSITTARS